VHTLSLSLSLSHTHTHTHSRLKDALRDIKEYEDGRTNNQACSKPNNSKDHLCVVVRSECESVCVLSLSHTLAHTLAHTLTHTHTRVLRNILGSR